MNRYLAAFGLGMGAFTLVVAACTATGGGAQFEDDDDGAGAGSVGGGSGNAGLGGNGQAGFDPGGGSGGGSVCTAGPDDDWDQDGYSINEGDCNDCTKSMSPAAIEVQTDPEDPNAVPSDEDCDGEIDEAIPDCDDGLELADLDPRHAAKAIDICHTVDDDGFGVSEALWVRANGDLADPDAMVGILENFGPNVAVRRGARMVGISSGHARLPGQPDVATGQSQMNGLDGDAPPGFPQDSAMCMQASDIHDDVGLQLKLRTPTNATGYSFDFSFYSFEYPEWVCTSYNDQFVALVSPPPQGANNGNISFDTAGNPVSVNIGLFQICVPAFGGMVWYDCPLGTDGLVGTGFDDGFSGSQGIDNAGATGWLVTTAPVEGGVDVVIRFAIWDTGDEALDSTAIMDNFRWIATPGVEIGTTPVPN